MPTLDIPTLVRRTRRATVGLLIAVLVASCDALITAAPDPADVLDGPLEGLTAPELAVFALGDAQFERRFSPAAGLGPIFNNVSCGGCHSGDGRGRAEPEFFNVVMRLNLSALPAHYLFDSPEIQRRALPGAEPEVIPVLPNSTGRGGGVPMSTRLPPPVFGLGLIEAIPVDRILSYADPNDVNADGISGRPHWVTPAPWVPVTEPGSGRLPRLGRFTRTARVSTIFEQVTDAYHKDMGITSEFLAFENVNLMARTPTLAFDRTPDPEVTADQIQQVVFYVRTLAPPEPGEMTAQRRDGESVFEEIGCATCHVPEMKTGPHAISALSEKPVRLYSDLLLHDMGDGLSDRVPEGDATAREWRTTPLWGLRVMRDFLNGDAFLLHDGRARTVEDAILLHGGEAQRAREGFARLSPSARAALLDFVESR
jgi:CxxC motif-containing protein (DUF1111 family)